MEDAGKINCLAVDGSDSSKHAFVWYIENMHRKDDTLVIIHVYNVPRVVPIGVMGAYVPVEAYKKMVDKNDCHGTGYEICNSVKKCMGNIVILGQRGIGKFSRFLLGSTSDYVLHHSLIPVVVIPQTN
nr:universal stress protein A-like protein [Hydra vulgaris]